MEFIEKIKGEDMRDLDKVIELNGNLVMSVRGSNKLITQYDITIAVQGSSNSTAIVFLDESSIFDEGIPDIRVLFREFEGKRIALVNSDIFDITNEKFKVKNLDEHSLKNILIKVIEISIPYLALVSIEEDKDILIQVISKKDIPMLKVTAGLVDDIQIGLFDIEYE